PSCFWFWPSKNWTVPVGEPADGNVAPTVAVSVTGWPSGADAGDAVSRTRVPAWLRKMAASGDEPPVPEVSPTRSGAPSPLKSPATTGKAVTPDWPVGRSMTVAVGVTAPSTTLTEAEGGDPAARS